MDTRKIFVNGLSLNVAVAGDSTHPLMIFLHGFPECHIAWEKQLNHFSIEYYCLAPDMRGYNLSDKPLSIREYTMDNISQDIIALIQNFGREKAIIVGHDWGAAIAWHLAINFEDKIEKLVVINVPHPLVMQNELKKNVRQLLKSWYIFYFQIPFIPEFLNRLLNFAWLSHALRTSSKPGTFSDETLDLYRNSWSQPNALRSMINYYRAFVRFPPKIKTPCRIQIPTLVIWGAKDKFLDRSMAQASVEFCENGHLALFENATHWVQHEEPDAVNKLIDEHLKGELNATQVINENGLSVCQSSKKIAYILGASVSGLLAAKALSTVYSRVEIIERDEINLVQPVYRKGVAQAKHAHVLLKRGLDDIEQLLPGFTQDILDNGGIRLDASMDWKCLFPMGWFPRYQSNMEVICASRVLIEYVIRKKVLAIHNISLRDKTTIENLMLLQTQSPVISVRANNNDIEQLQGDCVVNALGRNSDTLKWLNSSGFDAPKIETITSYLGYSTRYYKNVNLPEGIRASLIMAKDPNFKSGGIIYPVENNQYLVTLYGLGKNYPPKEDSNYLTFAKKLRSDLIYRAIASAEPLTPIQQFIKNDNKFCHFGKGISWPKGFLVLGDALCSPNPVYGQGMTTAANAAIQLQKGMLQNKDTKMIQRKITRDYALAWLNAKNEDLRWPGTEGQVANSMIRLMHRFMDRLLLVATYDKTVNYAFLRVLHMTASPLILMGPKILYKVFKPKKPEQIAEDNSESQNEKMNRTS